MINNILLLLTGFLLRNLSFYGFRDLWGPTCEWGQPGLEEVLCENEESLGGGVAAVEVFAGVVGNVGGDFGE